MNLVYDYCVSYIALSPITFSLFLALLLVSVARTVPLDTYNCGTGHSLCSCG